MHFTGVDGSLPQKADLQLLTPMDASFFSSAVNLETCIELVNKVQQCKANLNSRENKMMAQFQDVLSLIQSANSFKAHMLLPTKSMVKKIEIHSQRQQCN